MNKKHIMKFREAFKKLFVEKTRWRIDKGELDEDIKCFLNGDTLEVNLIIDFLPNDVIS